LAVRTGTTYPILTTATGQIFLAFGDVDLPGVGPNGDADVEGLREEVRARRLARVDQTFLVGVCAMAGPLFHQDGRLAAAVTIVGRPGVLDLAWDGPTARAIEAFTAACSDLATPR
jgi:DNA-binding IclR family transcriptional regulator